MEGKLRWEGLYRETELYRAALKVYTKSLFQWRKALSISTDGKTLYDFARHGLKNLESIHEKLRAGRFHFGPGAARTYNFNGKIRTLYIYPWEEKVVDLLLYRMLNARLHSRFSPSSYAYRQRSYGVDLCQARIAARIARLRRPFYLFKRDIANYFDSIDHTILTEKLKELVEPGDCLWVILLERIRFRYVEEGRLMEARRGVPFGTPVACLFANLYLTELDRRMDRIRGLSYFRYADDLLGLAEDPEVLRVAAGRCDRALSEHGLAVKPAQCAEHVVSERREEAAPFVWVSKFKHLGLEFRANNRTGLSRDKARKICNLFRYAFRRKRGRFRRILSPEKRAGLAVEIARQVMETGVRNVAILDYYLKHVKDEEQLRLLDRWLAEEVLSLAFQNGHRKGNFRRLSFGRLRQMGLPSLLHRSRMIRHGELETSFFRWREYQRTKGQEGGRRQARRAFSPCLEAAVSVTSWERGTACR